MANKNQQFIAYCLKQGYISMDKVRELLELSHKDKSAVSLIARELGWDKEKALQELRLSQNQQTSTHDKIIDEQDVSDGASHRTFGKYILVSKLGAGGMGAVYKAYHPDLQTCFAIKTISSGEIDNEQIIRFQREAKISSRLRHSNIVGVYDVGVENDQHYIVMEYIDGKDLSKIIKNEKILFRKALMIIFKISQALEYAHEMKVIHRDIKPGNIIISNNDEGTPYLMDFGLASTVQENTKLTRTGQILGTPQYMSPEQALGKANLDGRSDIYSLGTVLYEMLTSEPVVKAESNLALICSRIVNEYPIAPSKRNRHISKDLESITMKCLEKEPPRRYQTASELAKDIERYLEGEAVMARSPGPMYSLWRKVRRNWKISSLIAGFLIIVIGIVTFFALTAPDPVEIQILSLNEQAMDLEKHGNLKGAGNIYLSILKLNKGNAHAIDSLVRIKEKMYNEAMKYEREVNLRESKKGYEGILEFDNDYKKAKDGITRIGNKIEEEWNKANEFGNKKYFDKALELCRKLIACDPKDERFAKYILELTQSKETCRKESRKYYDRAMEVFWNPRLNEKEIVRCKQLFEEAIRIDPTFADVYFQAGRASHRLFNTKDAAVYYRKSLEFDSTLTSAKYYITALELSIILKEIDGSRPINDLVVNDVINTIYKKFNEIWSGIKDKVPDIELSERDPYTILAKAQLLLAKLHVLEDKDKDIYDRVWQECLIYCDRVINMYPNFSEAYFLRAQLYSYLVKDTESFCMAFNTPKNMGMALDDCNQGIYLDPFRMEFYNLRGLIYQSIGAYDFAEKDYSQAILLKNVPQSYFYRRRSVCYLAMKRFDLTLEDLNQSIKMLMISQSYSRDLAQTFIQRSLLKAISKDKKGAEEDFEKYLFYSKNLCDSAKEIAFIKTLFYTFNDDKIDKIENAYKVFIKFNAELLEQVRFVIIALNARETQGHFFQNTILLLQNIHNLFCVSPELKTMKKNPLLSLSTGLEKFWMFIMPITDDAFSTILQVCLEVLNKDPMGKEKLDRANTVLKEMYPPLTTDFFLYFLNYLSEKEKTQKLLLLKNLPLASLYYRRAIDYYINSKYEASSQDLEAALELEPNYMEAHYALSTVYSLLSEKKSSYRELALYHLKRAVENGWSHLEDYTLKDADFKLLGLGDKVPLEELRSWDKDRQENERRITEFSKNINTLISRGKMVEALRILYQPKPELFPKLNELINSTEKKVMEHFLEIYRNNGNEAYIDRRVEQLFGERGRVMWEWTKRGR